MSVSSQRRQGTTGSVVQTEQTPMTPMQFKAYENWLRAEAQRRGWRLVKSRRKTPRAVDYRAYWLKDESTGRTVHGGEFGIGLEEVERVLSQRSVRIRQRVRHRTDASAVTVDTGRSEASNTVPPWTVTDEFLAHTDHHALHNSVGRVAGVVGWDDLVGWFAAVAVDGGGWQTLDQSGSETQARQRVHAVVGGGRWVPVDTEAGEW